MSAVRLTPPADAVMRIWTSDGTVLC
jgi:hypothetical protein